MTTALAFAIASLLCCALNVAAYVMMKSDPWRYTKLSSALVSLAVFAISFSAVLHGAMKSDECAKAIAALVITEQSITSIGQIIRQIYLKRRRKCLLSIFRLESAS